jgi:hypothetical protein
MAAMTNSMIERVARALYERARNPAAPAEGGYVSNDEPPYTTLDGKWNLSDMARAAIEAMREPTEAMVTAGGHAALDSVSQRADARDAWEAMIDAALKE